MPCLIRFQNKFSSIITFGLLVPLSFGQAIIGEIHNSPPSTPTLPTFQIPYLFVGSDLNENGDGYQFFSGDVTAGAEMLGRYLNLSADLTYNFMRKTNDNAQVPGEKGRVRSASAELVHKFHPASSWFVSGGAAWGEASMTPYMKSSWSPFFGGGHDFLSGDPSWSLEWTYSYDLNEVVRYPTLVNFTAGPGQPALSYTCSLCGNDVKSANMTVNVPSVNSSAHWMMHGTFETDWFHETVTDPYDLSLTQSQKAQHDVSCSLSMGLIYRFKPFPRRWLTNDSSR
jgi:hypothetical protein